MQKRARNVFVSCYFQSEKAYIYLLPVVTPLWTLLLSSGEAPNLYTSALFPKASPTSVTVRQTKGEKKGISLQSSHPTAPAAPLAQALPVHPQSFPMAGTSLTQKGEYSASFSQGVWVVWVLLKDHSWSCSSSMLPQLGDLNHSIFHWNYLVTERARKPEWNLRSVATSFLPPGHCCVCLFLIRTSTSCHPSSNLPCPAQGWLKGRCGQCPAWNPTAAHLHLHDHNLSPKTTVFMVAAQPPSVPL